MIIKHTIITWSGLVFILLSCSGPVKKESQVPPPVPVNLYRIDQKNIRFYDNYPCTVVPLKEVGLRGEVSGYITGIYFSEGSDVHEGQKLYEIDRRQYDAAYTEASDNLKIAQSNLARVQLDVDRYSALNTQEAIARQRYDYALTDLANARLQVSVAREEEVKAKNNLDFSVIKAPFDGTIGISQVKLGDLVNPGQTLLNTISSDDPMGVDFVIDQAELSRFRELQSAKPSQDDSTFRLVLPDHSLYPVYGRNGLIDRAVDPQTGTIRVRLVFSNRDHDLRPGMDCEINVIHESTGPQIWIPYKAVQEQMSEYFVFLATKNMVKEIKVKLGPRVGSGVIVQEGLNPGDFIVVDGIGKLADGSRIETGTSTGNQ
jgi:membrane fusion protein (multidrug efflux system)